MFGCNVFSSHEILRLRREFPHHLVHEFRGDLGQPVFAVTLMRCSCSKAFRIHLGCDRTSGSKLFRVCPQRMLREDNALGLRRSLAESPAHAGMDRGVRAYLVPNGREPRVRGDGPPRTPGPIFALRRAPRTRGWAGPALPRMRCSSSAKSPPMPCCAHPPRVGTGRLSFWCSSVRIACGCPSAALVSSRPANRTCVPHNPPLTVKAGRVSPQGLRDASAPVRRELSQGLRPATSRPSDPAGRMVSPGQQGSARRRPRLVAATRRAGTRRCKSGRTL